MRSRIMLGGPGLVLVMLALGLGQLPSAQAVAITITTRTTVTLGSVRFYECAGEYIELRGDYQSVFHVTFDPTGGSHIVSQHNSQGISGSGLASGTPYHAVEIGDGGLHTTNIFGAPGFEYTDVDSFLLIGEGQASDLRVQVRQHVTYSPSIGFTVRVLDVTSECQ